MKKRNMMKKFFAVTAACAMAFSLAACSDASTQNTQPSQGGEGRHWTVPGTRRSQEL